MLAHAVFESSSSGGGSSSSGAATGASGTVAAGYGTEAPEEENTEPLDADLIALATATSVAPKVQSQGGSNSSTSAGQEVLDQLEKDSSSLGRHAQLLSGQSCCMSPAI